jgi:hypothetical protein
MTHYNLKLTEAALSNFAPVDEVGRFRPGIPGGGNKQEDDLARWSAENYPALVKGLDRVMTAIQLAQKNQKKMLQRMPSQANPGDETKVILDALVKFQKTVDSAIKLAQKQSK